MTKKPTTTKKSTTKPREDSTPPVALTTETEHMLAEELRYVPAQALFQHYVVTLAHLRDMFSALPQSHTIGKLRRHLPSDPDTDREGPMVARLRELVGTKLDGAM